MIGTTNNKYDHDLAITDQQTSFSKLLSRVRPGAVVLEFGCATGKMTKYLKESLHCAVYVVEIDRAAYDAAAVYAVNGLCGDIMNFAWAEAFAGISFDYILFADVLEHLTDPVSVIQRALALLEDSGTVLLSVPNIAHSAVIINLIHNKFEYKKIGLLDDTHIRFFTYFSLQELLDRCGLFPIVEDATYAAPKDTEFKNDYRDAGRFADALMDRPYEQVYQFIFQAVKKEHYYKNKDDFPVLKNITASAAADRVAIVYLDTGGGFNENERLLLSYRLRECRFLLSFDLPPGVKAIRFDPTNDKVCVIKNLEVVSNNGFEAHENANGVTMGSWAVFGNTSPHIYIPFKQDGAVSVRISGSLYECDRDMLSVLSKTADAVNELRAVNQSHAALTAAFDDLRGRHEQVTAEHNALLLRCDGITSERDTLVLRCAALTNERDDLARYRAALTSERDDLARRYAALTNEREALAAHCNAVTDERNALSVQCGLLTEQYNLFQQAFWWRVTKPARVVSGLMKSLLRSNNYTLQLYKTLFYLRRFGVKTTVSKIKHKLTKKNRVNPPVLYTPLSESALERQRQTVFAQKVTYSIITPLYNTDKRFLTEMLESVKAQTYADWELCLVDGSDSAHGHVKQICNQYAKKDKRIIYKKIKENKGISGNTNEALALATGDYISFLDHDDLLTPDALYETMTAICDQHADFVYSDEDKVNEDTSEYYEPHFKPDFAPDFLRANNYICHFVSVKREIVDAIGFLDPLMDGAQDFDFVLRAVEQAKHVFHIPKILYHWRAHQASTASNFEAKEYAIEAGVKAINRHLERLSLAGAAERTKIPGIYRVRYAITDSPLVSIIIPNKDHLKDLDNCISAIKNKSTYPHYEIIIVENNSKDEEIFQYYQRLEAEQNIKIVYYEGPFNYSKINNYGAKHADGAYLLFLNNDTEVISENWLEEMLMYVQRPEVGIVGAKLYYPDGIIQHAGVVFTMDGDPHHVFRKRFTRDDYGYFSRLQSVQNYSAVTGACLMIKKELFFDIGGFCEELVVAFNDIDLCMKVREKGHLIVWTPFSELYHHEMKSRGVDDTPEKIRRHIREITLFKGRWMKSLQKGDPYYNKNLAVLWED